jgi:hypothetical protein
MSTHPDENDQTLPATPADAIRRLGDPSAVFKPGMENLIAGIILALLMILAGLGVLYYGLQELLTRWDSLPLWHEKQSRSLFAFVAVAGLGLFVGGVFLIRWVRGLFSLRVSVCPRGFFWVSRKGFQAFPWDQIQHVRELVKQEYLPLKGVAKYAAPLGQSRSFVVSRTDGVQFAFDGNSVRKLNTLAKLIQEAVSQRGIPWDVEGV